MTQKRFFQCFMRDNLLFICKKKIFPSECESDNDIEINFNTNVSINSRKRKKNLPQGVVVKRRKMNSKNTIIHFKT